MAEMVSRAREGKAAVVRTDVLADAPLEVTSADDNRTGILLPAGEGCQALGRMSRMSPPVGEGRGHARRAMFPWWLDLIYIVGGLAFYASDPSIFRGVLGIGVALAGLGDLAFNVLLRLRANKQGRKANND